MVELMADNPWTQNPNSYWNKVEGNFSRQQTDRAPKMKADSAPPPPQKKIINDSPAVNDLAGQTGTPPSYSTDPANVVDQRLKQHGGGGALGALQPYEAQLREALPAPLFASLAGILGGLPQSESAAPPPTLQTSFNAPPSYQPPPQQAPPAPSPQQNFQTYGAPAINSFYGQPGNPGWGFGNANFSGGQAGQQGPGQAGANGGNPYGSYYNGQYLPGDGSGQSFGNQSSYDRYGNQTSSYNYYGPGSPGFGGSGQPGADGANGGNYQGTNGGVSSNIFGNNWDWG